MDSGGNCLALSARFAAYSPWDLVQVTSPLCAPVSLLSNEGSNGDHYTELLEN
jgi:hypothetical protein